MTATHWYYLPDSDEYRMEPNGRYYCVRPSRRTPAKWECRCNDQLIATLPTAKEARECAVNVETLIRRIGAPSLYPLGVPSPPPLQTLIPAQRLGVSL